MLGKALAEAFQENLSSAELPNGRMYYNIAQKVIVPMLENNYTMISDNAVAIQESLNQAAGIGIKGQVADFNTEKATGIVQRVADELNFDDIKWILDNPVINFSQSIVDDTIKKNAEFHSGAGLTARITRTAEAKACKWCRNLAGSYTYPDVPEDIWKRHENDRCVILYTPKKGAKTEIHTFS